MPRLPPPTHPSQNNTTRRRTDIMYGHSGTQKRETIRPGERSVSDSPVQHAAGLVQQVNDMSATTMKRLTATGRPKRTQYPVPLTPQEISSKKFSDAVVSKWLTEAERSIFCNVMESGDIVEVEGPGSYHHWGIGLRVSGASEGGPRSIEIACLWPPGISSRREQGREGKIVQKSLDGFWPEGAKIRINNRTDKSQPTHPEEIVRQQIQYAVANRNKQWHNCEHFAYWCRHGKVLGTKERQATDVGVWGSLAATAGAWRFMNRRSRRNTE